MTRSETADPAALGCDALTPTVLIGLGGMLAGLGAFTAHVFDFAPTLIVGVLRLLIGAVGFPPSTRGDEI